MKKSFRPTTASQPDTASVLALARDDLACFVAALRPDVQLAAHVMMLINRFEAIERRISSSPTLARLGQSLGLLKPPRDVIMLPPQHGKSTVLQLFCAWLLGRMPDRTICLVSYNADLAELAGKVIRGYLSHPLFQAIFPQCRISPDSNAVDHVGLTAGGYLHSVGRQGGVTGYRATALFAIDDLLKNRIEADSEATRAECRSFFAESALTRLSPNAGLLAVGTAWHHADLLSTLSREPGYRVLRLSALAEEGDEMGRAVGASLWPERHSVESYEAIKQSMGSLSFAALFQCRPSLREGSLFQLSWFAVLREPWTRPAYQRIVCCWDCAQGKDQHGDYSACIVAGVTNSHVDILQVWRGRPDLTALKAKAMEIAKAWQGQSPQLDVLIEDQGFGTALLQELPGLWQGLDVPRFRAAKAKGSKVARAEGVLGMCEAGRVRLADGPWLTDFQDELAAFPDGVNDDMVDALVHLLAHVQSEACGEPPPFTSSTSRFGIAELRDYLSGGAPSAIPAELSAKIAEAKYGSLSDREEWQILNATLPEWARDED